MEWLPFVAILIIPLIEVPLIIHFIKRYINKKYEIEKQLIIERMYQFIEPRGEDPSELAEIVDNIFKAEAPELSKHIYKSLMGNINQVKSVVAKNLNEAEGELVADQLAGGSPGTAGLLSMLLPKNWQKKLGSNPGLLGAIASMAGGPAGGSPNGNGNGSQPYIRRVKHR